MLGLDTFRLRTPFEDFLVRIERFAGPPNADQRALARRAFSELRFGLEGREPRLVEVAQQIVNALDGGAAFLPRSLGASLGDASFEADLLRRLEGEFERGRLVVEREQVSPLTERRDISVPDLPPLPPARRQPNTQTFEVRFVDEVGKGIPGIDAEFTADGAQTRPTNAAGVALLDNVQATSATVRILDVDALAKVLDPRWENFRAGVPPKESNTREVVFRGLPLGPFSLKSAVPNTVVIKPQLGILFAELRDKTGRVRHVNADYTIAGTMAFSGKTDALGRLRHEGVFPGDYTLSLAVSAFEGTKDERVDILECPLLVLSEDSPPQVRQIGAVPRVIMARMRGMVFDTNKTFLLPTAVPSLKRMRQVYEENLHSELLIVGHADTTGEPSINDPLSRDRARSMRAYLQDDVDTWLKNYGLDGSEKWGPREDRLMITAADGFTEREKDEDIVEWFQRTRDLKVDGIIGSETRRQLITEYMQLDGVNLIADPELNLIIESHGAGENFPLDETGLELDQIAIDEVDDVFNRRVEFFFFDDEFGVVPAPGAPDGPEYLEWRKRAVENEDLVAGALAPTPITLIEVKDIFFRTDSAVVHQNLVCPSVFALALVFARERRRDRLVIAGHTDRRARDSYNQPLSEERADNTLACLLGDRDSFVRLSLARHKVADRKQILKFVTKKLGFDCDPGAFDDNLSTLKSPARKFQEQYNLRRTELGVPNAAALDPDGDVGPLTWGAFFDCYEAFLATQASGAVGIDAKLAELGELRKGVQFVDDAKRAIGFGENFPVDRPGVDNLASATNRRVELLFFPEKDLPDLGVPNDVSEIYLPGRYKREQLDPCVEQPPPPPPPPPPKRAPGPASIFVRAVQVDGRAVANMQAFLFDITTGRRQVDVREGPNGEVDFGPREPAEYEVDIVKNGFDGGPANFTLGASERKIVSVLVTRVGETESSRFIVDRVVTVFQMFTRKMVSPVPGDAEVVAPPSIRAQAPDEDQAVVLRDRQAALEHGVAVRAQIAQLKRTHGSKFRRVDLDALDPVTDIDVSLEKPDPEEGTDVLPPIFLNATETVTSTTIVTTTVAT